MKKDVLKLPVLGSLLMLMAACASVDIAKMKTFPPKPESCEIDVYSEASAVKRKYEVACILGSSTGTTLFADKSVQHAIDIAKPEACKCGADGILVDSVTKTGFGWNGYGQGTASIKAITYTDVQ